MVRARPFLLLLPSLVVSVVRASALATCYYPDGTLEKNHVPCNQTISAASACCDPLDSCSVSGICLGRSGWTYRGSCTDRSWDSQNCGSTQLAQCLTDPSTKKKYNIFTPIWQCAPAGEGLNGGADSWCCSYANSSTSCCKDSFPNLASGNAFKPGLDQFILNITAAALASAPTASTNSTSSVTTNSSIACPAPNTTAGASTSPTPHSDIGTKVGLGVGIPLGILVAGLLGLLFYREASKHRGYGHAGVATPDNAGAGNGFWGSHEMKPGLVPTASAVPPTTGWQDAGYGVRMNAGQELSSEMKGQQAHSPRVTPQPPPPFAFAEGDVHELRG